MAGAGFGLKLHDTATGSNHLQPYLDWVELARATYLGLDGDELPREFSMYYDPLLDLHMRVNVANAAEVACMLAGVAPEDARRLYDASVARSHLVDEDPRPPVHPRGAAYILLLAKEWGLDEQAQRLQDSIDHVYEPTWNDDRGEFTWGLGLGEEHPRGQYNAWLAAAEAASEGAWWRLASERLPDGEGRVEGVDFPDVACGEALWDNDGALRVVLAPQHMGGAEDDQRCRYQGCGE